MNEKGVSPTAPMLIRAFKKESEFEIWKMRPDGTYVLLKTYPICRWSGQLGPKTHEGDRQSPEGIYTITPAMMNPNSSYYLSFNVGYPNAYDRAHGATGGSVMVHGICSSAGCFAMTDAQIADIYALARNSFAGGQHAIQMQSYPFHMNAQNLAKYRLDPNMPFWRELKKGDAHFEATKHDVSYNVCNKHYVFGAQTDPHQPMDAEAPCPPLKFDPEVETKVAALERSEAVAESEAVARGERPVRLVYKDGAQHPAFANRVAEVSRPDALVPPLEVALDDPKARIGAKTRSASASGNALLVAEAQAKAKSPAPAIVAAAAAAAANGPARASEPSVGVAGRVLSPLERQTPRNEKAPAPKARRFCSHRRLLSVFVAAGRIPAIDAGDERRRRLEGEHPARVDRRLDAVARVTSDPFALRAHAEGAERAQLHQFLAQEGADDFVERHFEKFARLRPRQRRTGSIDGVQQIGARRGLSRPRLDRDVDRRRRRRNGFGQAFLRARCVHKPLRVGRRLVAFSPAIQIKQ